MTQNGRTAFASLGMSAAFLCLAHAAPSQQETSIEAFRNRVAALDQRFKDVGESTQQQLDAANCRAGCPPEVGRRLSEAMMTAVKGIAADIHSEVDSFIRTNVGSASNARLDPAAVTNQLQGILPTSVDEARAAYVGGAADHRYLLVAYCLHKGTLMGPNATSVTVRAYTQSASGLALADVIGDNMDGFDGIVVKEVHPQVFAPGAVPIDTTYLLLSGYMSGANGPHNRMRVYAFDGQRFRIVWMPEDVWGRFDVQVTAGGFTVDGDYYREGRTRHDAYLVSEDGVTLVSTQRSFF